MSITCRPVCVCVRTYLHPFVSNGQFTWVGCVYLVHPVFDRIKGGSCFTYQPGIAPSCSSNDPSQKRLYYHGYFFVCNSFFARSLICRTYILSNVRTSKRAQVMLASLTAAGTGINLTSANHCFICDRKFSCSLYNTGYDSSVNF